MVVWDFSTSRPPVFFGANSSPAPRSQWLVHPSVSAYLSQYPSHVRVSQGKGISPIQRRFGKKDLARHLFGTDTSHQQFSTKKHVRQDFWWPGSLGVNLLITPKM